jgi:ABC-type Mn2+/Zn2+ transport system permease subunit/Mn-dependent DtxR family transcriptional regulator
MNYFERLTTYFASFADHWDLSQWSAPFTSRWIDETLCTMLVGLTLGVLGTFVVLRRMALIGDALSHAVLPGVVLAFIITQSSGVAGLLLGALLAGLLTAVLINVISHHTRTKEDSAIGIVFTALFALGIILISNLPRGTHFDLKCFLFGDPLAIGREDLLLMVVVCPLVLLTIGVLYHRFKLTSFDPVLAAAMGVSVATMHYLLMGMLSATVVAGLKTTGVILVVAMVITPASAAYQLTNRFSTMLVLSGVFGAASAMFGMSVAFVTNSPTGPAMVVVAVVIFVLAVMLSPQHGWVFGRLRKRRLSRHIDGEDVLKAMYRLGRQTDGPGDHAATIATEAGQNPARTTELLASLTRAGFARASDTGHTLTPAGRHHAEQIVRSHRLWETYLNTEAGISDPLLHDEAERLEHAHELAEELAAQLGDPDRDPHGSTIPRRISDSSDHRHDA